MRQMHSEFNYEWETDPGGRLWSPRGSCETKGGAGDEVRGGLEDWGCLVGGFDIQ